MIHHIAARPRLAFGFIHQLRCLAEVGEGMHDADPRGAGDGRNDSPVVLLTEGSLLEHDRLDGDLTVRQETTK